MRGRSSNQNRNCSGIWLRVLRFLLSWERICESVGVTDERFLKTNNGNGWGGVYSWEELLALVRTEPEVVVLVLQGHVRVIQGQVSELRQEEKELKERLALNSRNSHKPLAVTG